jgi:hypothetical protein
MPYGGTDAHKRGLGQELSPVVFQEGLGHRDEPFVRPVVAVEVMIEGEEALQVAALGVQGGLRLASDFDREIEGGKISKMIFGGLEEGRNVMG